MSKSKLARDAVEWIVKDIRDRRGIGHPWEAMDVDVRREIKAEWMRIILNALSENPELDYKSDAPWIFEGGERSVPQKRAAQILVTHPVKELFLVVKEESGDVLLPGGHIEVGESIWKGAQRELKEETDLYVYYEDLVPIGHGFGVAEPDCEVDVYLARKVFGQEKPVEHGTSLHWTDWKWLAEHSSFKPFYEKYFPKGFSHLKPTEWKQ